jgi:uncharacterized repeat protein (TIGR01451 family)
LTVTAQSTDDAHRPSRPPAGRSRAGFILAGLVIAIGAFMLAPASSVGDHQPKVCTTNQQQGKLCLVASDTPDPVAYSTFDGNSVWLQYHAVVSNESRSSSLSHVGLIETLPAGTSFVEATSSRGSCTGAAQSVSCSFGSLKKGQAAGVDVVVTAPASAALNPPNITISNTLSASFDERFNDSPGSGGKQDSVTYIETTTVSKTAGQAYVPRGRTGKVGTDPAVAQYASSLIPSASTNVLASVDIAPPDSFCQGGKVTVRGKSYICRDGAFVEVSITDAVTGATYSNANNPLVFHLRWDASLVSDKQTNKNLVVFYQSTPTAPIQVFDTACNAAASNTPCLRNPKVLADGSAEIDVVKNENGRMR